MSSSTSFASTVSKKTTKKQNKTMILTALGKACIRILHWFQIQMNIKNPLHTFCYGYEIFRAFFFEVLVKVKAPWVSSYLYFLLCYLINISLTFCWHYCQGELIFDSLFWINHLSATLQPASDSYTRVSHFCWWVYV